MIRSELLPVKSYQKIGLSEDQTKRNQEKETSCLKNHCINNGLELLDRSTLLTLELFTRYSCLLGIVVY